MTQYLVEEAARAALDLHEANLEREAYAKAEQDAAIEKSTQRRDRAMQAA